MTARRKASYQGRRRQVMAERGMFTAAGLVPHLAERGITLSASQVHRLVTGTPERLSLPVLAALCDIFDVTPADLIVTSAGNVTAARKTRTDGPAALSQAGGLRPSRARRRPPRVARPHPRPPL